MSKIFYIFLLPILQPADNNHYQHHPIPSYTILYHPTPSYTILHHPIPSYTTLLSRRYPEDTPKIAHT
ncbi:MAG: hypothetical protein IKB40_03765 [Paludibacteraceae bacterium]|nr:hypothetical protein [Paludibacteraceae bacterium]